MNDPAFLQKISKDAAMQRHNLNVVSSDTKAPFVESVFLPHFPVNSHHIDNDLDVSYSV